MSKKRFQIDYLAHLGRLKLLETEKTKYSEELSDILDYIEQLQGVGTQGVEPINQIIGLKNVMREDKRKKCLETGEVFKNAPAVQGDYFKIKAIFKNRDE